MLVKAIIKTKSVPNKECSQPGDIIYFWPVNKDHGSKTFNSFMAVVMDLNVPCGKEFDNQPPKCGSCKYQNPDECDVIKYTKGVWESGTLFDAPKLLLKNRYTIDRAKLISGDTETLVAKEENTDEEKEFLLTSALKNPVDKNVIKDKVI